ncbi:hypothetical protein FQA39_LY10470 [Lamprigera yunnana]|nr:hypothetical protein FQA39_LY10470 [Lamprigera yunnana]
MNQTDITIKLITSHYFVSTKPDIVINDIKSIQEIDVKFEVLGYEAYEKQEAAWMPWKQAVLRVFPVNFQVDVSTILITFCSVIAYDMVDSIPTSCIQLAKEQIIKYSDPKYNINDLKTGDCETMLLNQTIYYLNKSKSKWISVGLYYPFEFASVVKIFGRSKQYVIFKEEEWIQFHEQRENINKYFQTFDTMWKPRQIGSKT